VPLVKTKSAKPDKETSLPSDKVLVARCLEGDADSWSALLGKYQALIYSIPIRYGFSREEAADIFQAVCLDLIQQLGKVREPNALPKWLMQVTAHKCFHAKRQSQRLVFTDSEETFMPEASVPPDAEFQLREVEEEQILRQALNELQPRCRSLIEMLFFEDPKRPYQEVAASLGLATGTIGLLRQKCLEHLRKSLDKSGF